jgi:hypothetical protein
LIEDPQLQKLGREGRWSFSDERTPSGRRVLHSSRAYGYGQAPDPTARNVQVTLY